MNIFSDLNNIRITINESSISRSATLHVFPETVYFNSADEGEISQQIDNTFKKFRLTNRIKYVETGINVFARTPEIKTFPMFYIEEERNSIEFVKVFKFYISDKSRRGINPLVLLLACNTFKETLRLLDFEEGELCQLDNRCGLDKWGRPISNNYGLIFPNQYGRGGFYKKTSTAFNLIAALWEINDPNWDPFNHPDHEFNALFDEWIESCLNGTENLDDENRQKLFDSIIFNRMHCHISETVSFLQKIGCCDELKNDIISFNTFSEFLVFLFNEYLKFDFSVTNGDFQLARNHMPVFLDIQH